MPQIEKSCSASVQLVDVQELHYSASVQPARWKDYTASAFVVIRPDRYYTSSVELVPAGTYIGYLGSVYAKFDPITPDRYYSASASLTQTLLRGQFYTGSVLKADVFTFQTLYTGSVVKNGTTVSKTYTGSTVARLEVESAYNGSVYSNPAIAKTYTASSFLGRSTALVYTASVIKKKLDVDSTYTGSVRPVVEVSSGEQSVRDTDINLLIALVAEKHMLEQRIAQDTARLAFDEAEIDRLVDILNQVTNKPSCVLSSVSPKTGVLRRNGSLTLLGNQFIPTSTAHLSQGATSIGDFELNVSTRQVATISLPDFTLVGGLNLALPISIRVDNADGEVSETITFTLASS